MNGAGALDQLVTIQRRTATPDGGGGVVEAWADLPINPRVWADPQPLYGKEGVQDGARNATGTWLFKIRNRTDLTEQDRIVWDGDFYNISQIKRRGGRELYLMIEAVRGVAQ